MGSSFILIFLIPIRINQNNSGLLIFILLDCSLSASFIIIINFEQK